MAGKVGFKSLTFVVEVGFSPWENLHLFPYLQLPLSHKRHVFKSCVFGGRRLSSEEGLSTWVDMESWFFTRSRLKVRQWLTEFNLWREVEGEANTGFGFLHLTAEEHSATGACFDNNNNNNNKYISLANDCRSFYYSKLISADKVLKFIVWEGSQPFHKSLVDLESWSSWSSP